jgi:hypothetical protein
MFSAIGAREVAMEFVVKDLMISVLPLRASAAIAARPEAESDPTCGTCTGCTGISGGCGAVGTRNPLDFREALILPVGPAVLATLKQQLREALAMVEAREAVVHRSMQPKSAAEIEVLQTHLTAALESLQEQAAKLRGGNR